MYLSPEPLAKPKPWGLETKPKSPAGTTPGAGVGMPSAVGEGAGVGEASPVGEASDVGVASGLGKILFTLEGEALGGSPWELRLATCKKSQRCGAGK